MLKLKAFLTAHTPTTILLAYVVLVVIYSAVTPIFEAPDESYHFGFIQHLAYSPDLPIEDPKVNTPWFQEGGQPPLYYALVAPVVRLATAQYDPYPLQVNPFAETGFGVAPFNHNEYVHNIDESFPWKGIPLAVHLIRLLNIPLGLITIYLIYRISLLALPEKPGIAILAMALVAFNPMFLFISGSVNNDNLVTLFSTVALWLMLVILQQGLTMRRAGMLSLALAIAALSKASGMALYVSAGALLLLMLLKSRIKFRQALVAGLMFTAAFAVLTAWWYIRNVVLYHDPTAMLTLASFMETRHDPYTFRVMLIEMEGLRYSSWALFGWYNVIGPMWFLQVMDVFTALATIGGVIWGISQVRNRRFEPFYPLGLLSLHFLVVFAGFISWNRVIWSTHGRLLFPAIATMAILLALGWHSLTELRKGLRPLAALPAIFLFIMAVLLPFFTIIPAYAPPPIVAQLPSDAVPVNVRFDKVDVLGFKVSHQPAQVGGTLPITLYYRGQPDPRNLSLYLTALDQNQQPIGKVDSYPGGGNMPTSIWESNAIYADTYYLPIKANISDPMQARIQFGWYDFATKDYINPVHEDGSSLDALILHGGTILPNQPASAPTIKQQAIFSGALQLNGYTLSPTDTLKAGDQLQVSLNWQGLTTVYEDFTVFVHLETPDGQLIAQDDSPPLGGNYPTSAWAVGQPFNDVHTLKLDAPGTYRLSIGLYRPKDLTRLPVDAGGDSLILQTPIVVQ